MTMAVTSITARDLGDFAYEVGNGRATISTAWNPEEGRFLATELFLAGLGTCMLATMMYTAKVMGLDLSGASVRVDANSATGPDRLEPVRVVYVIPTGFTDAQKAALIRAGNRCKVHATIEAHPTFDVSIEEAL